MNGRELHKINENMKNTRSLWDALWKDIADNIVFRKTSIVGTVTQGSKLTSQMYSSTATLAGQDLAAWINGNLTTGEWFSLKMGGMLKEVKQYQEWIEECRKIQHEEFRDSNWAGEWNEVLLDLVNFCTGALYVEENEVEKAGFNGLNFIAMSPGTYCHMLGRDGRTKCVFRELKLKANQAIDKFGEDKCSDDIKESAKKDPSKEFDFIHGVFPRDWFGGNHRIKTFPYVSYYVDVSKKTVVKEGGFHWFPFFVIPYLRESGEDYGRGPGITALPDVKTLHKSSELNLKEWALAIWPPLTAVDQGVIGTVQLSPGGITVVSKSGGHDNLKPLITGARYSDNRQRFEDLKADIKEVYHGDKVKFIPPRDQTGQMTAYEVARRYELAQLLLGPTFGNIVDHGFDPMIECTFQMMLDGGAFPQPPGGLGELLRQSGGKVHVEYESPIARAYRMQEVNSIQNTVQAVATMVEVKPDIFDNFKLDDAAVAVAKALGFPERLIEDEGKRDEIRQLKGQIAQQQQQIEQLGQIAKAARDGAGAMSQLPAGMMQGMKGAQGEQ